MISEKASNQYKNMTATGIVFTGAGRLAGIIVSTSSSLTIKAWDNTAGSGTIIFNTTASLVAATSYNCFNIGFTTGLFLTVTGTGDFCVVWHPE